MVSLVTLQPWQDAVTAGKLLATLLGQRPSPQERDHLLVLTAGLLLLGAQAASSVYYIYACLPLLLSAFSLLAKHALSLERRHWHWGAVAVILALTFGPHH